MKLPSRVLKNRHGIYYLRTQRFGVHRRISLHTLRLLIASLVAYKHVVTISSMDIDKLKYIKAEQLKQLTLEADGVKITTDGGAEDQKMH